ncbi:cell division ATPase MinD [Methanolobus halotolerans]|uniref:Septum site-determining protein MinD n=1 Tax=Methanolobus halotolerans TaxID=2052935 RepID=A0A4E0QDL9_9EURY|nr:cell division ATPase MinD [Methanolobus halotolerans]TGC11481.1 septum site-determining protein MinD [Methanolobus halotolerans]
MTAKIYTIISGKGGTGSTTAVISIGAALAGFAKKTLIVDADLGMPTIGLMLGLETKATLHDVLSGDADVRDAIYDGPNNLKVLPGSISLHSFMNTDPGKLADLIESIREKFEFILIDSPTGISKNSLSVVSLADEIIQLMNPDIASLAGAMKVKAISDSMGKQFFGVMVNRTGVINNELSNERIETTLGLKILENLPEDPNVKNSVAFKAPIVVKYPGSPVSVGFNRLSAEIAGIKVPAIETFVEDKSKQKKGKRTLLSMNRK